MVNAKIWIPAVIASSMIWYIIPPITFIKTFAFIIFKLGLYILFGAIGIAIAVYIHRPKIGAVVNPPPQASLSLIEKTREKLGEYKLIPRKSFKQKTFISRNVDDFIEELITLLLRDYVNSWYDNIVKEPSLFCNKLKPLIRQMLFTFRDRCQKIDSVKFITSDIVVIITKHLQAVERAAINPDNFQPYKVSAFLETKEGELNYLRKISEFLLITLLPPEYTECMAIRHLLREVFACTVFYNVLEKICDPDLINMRIIGYLKNQQEVAQNARPYAVAETYEDFIKMIQECGSIERLQSWRYYIVSEIMHATTMSNVKRAKGMDADKEFNTQRTNKGDLLEARNLSRYLNQLRFAKNCCEKRIKLLGGQDFLTSPHSSFGSSLDDPVPGQKVLSMSVLMQSRFCRRHFSKFLQKEEMHSLIGLWEAVEDIKSADKSMWHQLGNDIVQMYIHNQANGVHLSKSTLKGIEEFMMANKGPEAFFRAQEEVYRQLEEKHYGPFIVSDTYHKMLAEAAASGIDFTEQMRDDKDDLLSESSMSQTTLEKSDESDVSLFDHTSYARSQLKVLQAKLNEKLQAFSALRNNPKCDKKVIRKMDKEIQDLCLEQSMLQNHIEKTELWIKYLGLWQATVVQAEVSKENEKNIPFCNVMVHLSNESGHPECDSVGWVVSRSLNAFHGLHQKLVPAANWLKKIELPTKPVFKSVDENFLEKSKMSLQSFLSAVTKDDSLNKSEALYSFLSPSPEHMKYPPSPEKKPFKFGFMQLFKNFQNTLAPMEDEQEEELLFLYDTDSKEDKKDSIAESLYILIGEVFEISGVFSWLRRSLIIFVQITYGRTINRQLRETVSSMLSEPMLLSYLQMFKDTMWPKNPQPNIPRTDEDKFETKCIARAMLLASIPEVLSNFLGHQNTRKGVAKIFHALQDKTLNKQLLCNILEAFLSEYAPELKRMSSRGRASTS